MEGASIIFVFFFSSRRRHTRFDCDWSSDVCSSDLNWPFGLAKFFGPSAGIASYPQAVILPDSLAAELRGETRKAGTWPPPLVTLARPVALRRVRKPQSFPRNRYGAKSTSMSR